MQKSWPRVGSSSSGYQGPPRELFRYVDDHVATLLVEREWAVTVG